MRPAFISVGAALLIEIPLCITMSIWGTESFARYLSGSDKVAKITEYMWRVRSPFFPERIILTLTPTYIYRQ